MGQKALMILAPAIWRSVQLKTIVKFVLNDSAGNCLSYYLCQGAYSMLSILFVGVFVSRIMDKLLPLFSWKLVEEFSMCRGRHHYILEGIGLSLRVPLLLPIILM